MAAGDSTQPCQFSLPRTRGPEVGSYTFGHAGLPTQCPVLHFSFQCAASFGYATMARKSMDCPGDGHIAMSKSLFSGINDRIAAARDDSDVALFHALMYKLEFLTKVITSGVVACLANDESRHRYTREYELVRADSIGVWTKELNEALVGASAECMEVGARDITRDLTERVGRGDWRYVAVSQLRRALKMLGANTNLSTKEPLRRFFEIGVQMRNRARGHGAPRPEQCGDACSLLEPALYAVERKTKVLCLPWVRLRQNLSGKYRVTSLLNDPTSFAYLKRTREAPQFPTGVYLYLDAQGSTDPIRVPFVFTDSDLLDVWLPNGNYRSKTFELLSYATGDTRQEDASRWSAPPNKLPESETEGAGSLELVGNILTNAPSVSRGYISRPELEAMLAKELETLHRHPIVTLTGQGGIGKTTLALQAIATISRLEDAPYNVVLWISARDIDLLETGPKPVSQRVFKKSDVTCASAVLLEHPERESKHFDPDKYFEQCLRDGWDGPTLFVFDNFETLNSPSDVFEWIDAHVRPPNKVLITTRFRDFKADYPIGVSGMLDEEAAKLIDAHAARLDIRGLVSQRLRKKLIEEAEGHPYVIKILLGEVARERRAVAPKRVVADAGHLLDVLFKRTYAALNHAAQRVFLLLSSWNVYVPEVAVEAVLLRPGVERFDVKKALDEVVRYSLVERTHSDNDGAAFVGIPLAAAMFGRRELEVSPIKPLVEEDRKLLMDFGAGKKKYARRSVLPRIQHFIRAVATRAASGPDQFDNDLPVLEYLARRFPGTYLILSDLVLEVDGIVEARHRAKEYVRSFLQDAKPSEKRSAWLKLERLYRMDDDMMGEVQSICESALLPTTDLQTFSNDANRLNNRIYYYKNRKSGISLPSGIRNLLTRVAEKLHGRISLISATDCSRLAWLFVNAGNIERAVDVARTGVEKEPSNEYCTKFIEKFQNSSRPF